MYESASVLYYTIVLSSNILHGSAQYCMVLICIVTLEVILSDGVMGKNPNFVCVQVDPKELVYVQVCDNNEKASLQSMCLEIP